MKRFLPLLLIPLALVHMSGVAPFYFTVLHEVKTEMTLELAKEEGLSKVFVSDEEFNNLDIFQTNGESEFRYLGRMYDYAKMVQQQGGYMFYCLEDTKESLLKNLLQSTFDEGSCTDPSNRLPFMELIKNFAKDFTPSAEHLFSLSLSVTEIKITGIEALLSQGHYLVFFPPPDE